MAYKKLIKVSNVCQLLDKSKYPATQTINGVTFTNNGDGTITVNGTATEYTAYHLQYSQYFPYNLIGRICLIESNLSLPSGNTIRIHTSNWDIADSRPIGKITSVFSIWISVFQGYTANNLVFKPQLFDLTEMYGAGHEPTSVEQFRQDFPEELYDYSPHCWLTSYKRVFMTGGGNYLTSYQRNLTCKTKNLLNPNTCDIYQSVAFGMNIELIDNNQTVHVYGTSTFTSASAAFNVIKTSDKSIYNKGYNIKFFNLEGKNPPVIRNIYGLREIDTVGQIAILVNITEGVYYDFSFRIMVSAQTATDYVPYGYL